MLNHRSIATQGVGAGLGARAAAVQGFAAIEFGPYPIHIAAGTGGSGAVFVVPADPGRRPKRRRREEEELVLLGLLVH
jgi:hypothetical protein